VTTSPEDILNCLKPHLSGATQADEVAALMASLTSDFAWAYLGGSGARQQIFRIEGDLRAVFEFDAADKLVAYGAYCDHEPWEAVPAGAPTSPVSSSDVSLILVD
jgi:hypothetical protein